MTRFAGALIALVVACALLAACGQKGPLVLPRKQPSGGAEHGQSKPQSNSSSKPDNGQRSTSSNADPAGDD